MNNCNCNCEDRYELPKWYIVGENRPIKLRATDKNTKSFIITDADYMVFNKGGAIVREGQCEIDNEDHTVMMWFNPQESGTHTISFTVIIPPAVRKIDLIAKVRKQGEVPARWQ